jgi:Arm DNA-binding domain
VRAVNRLTAMAIRRQLERGLYADGNGLYLQVSAFGTKAWVYRYQRNGSPRMMGLGAVNTSSVAAARKSLAGARERAQDAHELLLRGTDPIDARQSHRAQALTEKARLLPSSHVPKSTSKHIALAGRTLRTPISGRRH